MPKRKDRYEFIWNAIQVHGYKDDLREVDYKNNKTKVKILCPVHGEYWITPNDYIGGHRCRKCYDIINAESKLKGFDYHIKRINEIHKNEDGTPKYNFDGIEYPGYDTKFELICPIHGPFKTTIHLLLSGKGCAKCGKERMAKRNTLTNEIFKENANKIHNNFYNYDLVEYKNSKLPIKIICPIHSVFEQTPNDHLDGHGCPLCNMSLLEKSTMSLLDDLKINYIWQCNKRTLPFLARKKYSFSLDFYIPDYNIAIECQGIQHFKPIEYFGGEKAFKECKQRDNEKLKLCQENNVKLIYINYFDKPEEINAKINEIKNYDNNTCN